VSETLRIGDELHQGAEGRFARFELISWWDQERLASAKVLVIGAGALGNEILKNLALLGIGSVFVADLDTVENSNLSRSVLFRAEDCGRAKAEVAAERAREIYPQQKVRPYRGNIVYDLGLGVYRWADVIIGGLDNREARVAINAAASRAGKAWIDGAIERLDGVARVFDPAIGPCYECTMSEVDWKMLEARRSCALLSRDEMEAGKVPTTPTTGSVIAGIQVQEAVKFLHGMDTLSGQGFVFDGTYHQSYLVTYTQKPDCPMHEPLGEVTVLEHGAANWTVGELLERVRADMGRSDAVAEFNQDLLAGLHCARCGESEPLFASLGKVTESQGRCPQCGEHRAPEVYHTLGDDERREAAMRDRTLREIGVPLWDVLTGRAGAHQLHYELGGDKAAVLGELAME
jgi:adenylyltransferase/sulfurtransferase